MSGPLTGIRVLDLSRVMAGPWSTQILADLGADVIKVERPGVGDDTRQWGPPFLPGEDGAGRNSGYYLSVNRGKRSVLADLATAEGRALIETLAAQSDILVENYKVDTLARYGLDYASLSARHPRLIYCSITGFGQTGPRRAEAAYDFVIQAIGGLMSVTGRGDDEAGGGPQKVGIPIVDIMTGMYATIAVLAALEHRNRTGVGEYIDLAMLDVQAAFLANQAMNHLLTGAEPRRTGNRHPNIQPQNIYDTGEGQLALAVGNDGQFAKLCDALGIGPTARDPDYATNAARVRNRDALDALLIQRFSTDSAIAWEAALVAAGVPAGRINTVGQVFDDPQIRERGMLQHQAHSRGGTIPTVVSPMRFSNAPLSFDRAAPLLGEHHTEILAELGLAEKYQEGRANAAHQAV